jgi:hypothetical protein
VVILHGNDGLTLRGSESGRRRHHDQQKHVNYFGVWKSNFHI